jgi:hypothetical protein
VKKSRITIIVLSIVLSIALLVYFIMSSLGEKRYQWNESYRTDSDQPYGILFITKLLEGYRPDGKFVLNEKKPLKELLTRSDLKANTDYIFIGQSIHLDEEDKTALRNFIHDGNDAFIAALGNPKELIDAIYQHECAPDIEFESTLLDSVTMNFYHDALHKTGGYTYAYRFRTDDEQYYWNTFSNDMFCEASRSVTPLGYQEPDKVNFLKITYGGGNLYLHSNPLAFTNYFLLKQDKVDYATGVFSHLSGKNIIWDEYSKIPFIGNPNKNEGPLYYILQQPSLKYAWWMLLLSVVLYVLFASKRTQRIIPVFEPKTNTSLEYVNLISALHYQNGNHLDMAKKKMRYFLYFIRSKYGIHAQTFTEEQMKKLSDKSKVGLAEIRSIFSQYHIIERNSYSNIEANRLLDLYYAIEHFYKNCK